MTDRNERLRWFLFGIACVVSIAAVTSTFRGAAVMSTATIGTSNGVEISSPSSDTLKILIDADNAQSGYKKFQIFTGDHSTNPVYEWTNDGDALLMTADTNAGAVLYQIGGDATSSYLRRAVTGAGVFAYANGNLGLKVGSADGTDKFIWYDNALATLAQMDSDGFTTFGVGLAIPAATELPARAGNGSIAVDTDVSANGSLYVFCNGSWRKVVDLP